MEWVIKRDESFLDIIFQTGMIPGKSLAKIWFWKKIITNVFLTIFILIIIGGSIERAE